MVERSDLSSGLLYPPNTPRFMRVNAEFNVRGGVYTRIVAEHRADGWIAPEPVNMP